MWMWLFFAVVYIVIIRICRMLDVMLLAKANWIPLFIAGMTMFRLTPGQAVVHALIGTVIAMAADMFLCYRKTRTEGSG